MIRSNLFPVLVFFAASLMSCSFFSQGTKIEFVLAQTPKFELNEIDALEVGQFKGQPLVKISLPVKAEVHQICLLVCFLLELINQAN